MWEGGGGKRKKKEQRRKGEGMGKIARNRVKEVARPRDRKKENIKERMSYLDINHINYNSN